MLKKVVGEAQYSCCGVGSYGKGSPQSFKQAFADKCVPGSAFDTFYHR